VVAELAAAGQYRESKADLEVALGPDDFVSAGTELGVDESQG
jgi:hypothetical protein